MLLTLFFGGERCPEALIFIAQKLGLGGCTVNGGFKLPDLLAIYLFV
jgi:hypothetical protein